MKKLLGLIFFATLSANAWGFEPTNIADQYPSLGRSLRPLGMGNAYLTMEGTDQSSFFYNPASINDFDRGLSFGLVSPQLDFTTASIGLIKDIMDLSDDLSGQSDADQTTTFDTFFDQHVGEFHSLNLWLPLMSVQHRWFSLNLIADSRTSISLRNRAFPNFEVYSRNDGGVAAGTAYGFLDNSLQVGLGLKFLYRAAFSEIITTADAIGDNFGDTFEWDNLRKGFGVGADLGTKYQIPDFDTDVLDYLKPTVAVVWQDIGNTRFSGGAPKTQQSISAGVGFHPSFGPVDTSLDVDVREINQKRDFMTKFHTGVEARFGKFWPIHPAIRAGINQGYPAFGAGFDTRIFKFNVAYYAEEVGKVTRQKGNYRLATNLSFGF